MKFTRVKVDCETEASLKAGFMAFDTETTGLRAGDDRIVELGAVIFRDGRITDTYGTLVNPAIRISPSATAVNGITNGMLDCAPCERAVYPEFMCFLDKHGVLDGETILAAHNAPLDIGFLREASERFGLEGNIRYCDTLALSRARLPQLEHHRQSDVAEFFRIENRCAHRAVEDAEVCGRILWEMIS